MRWTLLMLLAHRIHLLHLLITDGMETSHVIKCFVQKVIGLECSLFFSLSNRCVYLARRPFIHELGICVCNA